MSELSSLKPERVFHYFEEMSRIPRGSGNIWGISDYLVQFAKDRELAFVQDEVGNVVIKKPGTEGYEQSETVIIQGHMDMVCEKNADCKHDFQKDPITLIVEGDFVRADDTTLGADDGIALAYALAVLESSELPHPPLEAVFTVDEEVGMDGALALDASSLQGTKLLNVDSEEEGILWSSCAGGMRCLCSVALERIPAEQGSRCVRLGIKGLLGGHSGTEIHKGRGNANKLLGEWLAALRRQMGFSIVSLEGGMKDNAIPREAVALVTVRDEQTEAFLDQARKLADELISVNRSREAGMETFVEETACPEETLSEACGEKCLLLLNALPNGVVDMSAHIPDLVETSLNVGVMRTEAEEFTLDVSLRSSVSAAKALLKERVSYLAEAIGGRCKAFGDYPAWEYREESELRETFARAYEKLTGKKMQILALHAGLECGILTDKIKNADCVSFGPNIYDIHTPMEKMSISSVERTYQLLLEVLKNLK